MLRTPEDIPADKGATEFQERFVNVSSTIEANTKTTEVVEPRVSAFNHPAEFPQTAAMFSTTLRDHRLDAALAKSLTMRVGIVATIGIDDLGLLKRPAAHAANRRDRVNKRQQLGNVVAVRTGQDHADGNAVCVDEDVVFGTGSRDPWGSGQFFARPNGSYRRGIDRSV